MRMTCAFPIQYKRAWTHLLVTYIYIYIRLQAKNGPAPPTPTLGSFADYGTRG